MFRTFPASVILLLVCSCSNVCFEQVQADKNCKLSIEVKSGGSAIDDETISRLCIFVFDANGKPVERFECGNAACGHVFLLSEGKYSVIALAGDYPSNFPDADLVRSYIQSMEFNPYTASYPGFPMAGETEVTLKGQDHVEKTISLDKSCSRIRIAGIKVVKNSFLQNGNPSSFTVEDIFIMDARTKVHTDGSAVDGDIINTWNGSDISFPGGTLESCTRDKGSYSLSFDTRYDHFTGNALYCAPGEGSRLVIKAGVKFNERRYLWYYRVPLHLRANRNYEYDLTICGPGALTPVGDFPGNVICNFSAEDWMKKDGGGYEDSTRDAPSISYSLIAPQKVGDKGKVVFDAIFGDSLVSSCNEEIVDVVGGGRIWELFGRGSGTATLQISDGANCSYETLTIQ